MAKKEAASSPDFIHRYVPPATNENRTASTTILALHGTGGNEDDMIPFARQISAGTSVLSPRGKVLENGMPRFFRRLAEGVFDMEDLKLRTYELAQFVKRASETYRIDPIRFVALGYSNGANMTASLLLMHPEVLAGAILLRPMVPFVPEEARLPSLRGKPVLIMAGRDDRIVAHQQSEGLRELLSRAGANTHLAWVNAGHSLTQEDLVISQKWFAEHFP